MKKFINKILLSTIPILVILVSLILLPTTPRASKSLLMAAIRKDSLLKNSPAPRIIFVGGSNTSFGLDSEKIKDSLKLNPINTGIHASIGIKHMIDNTSLYIKKGDIIILIPEYTHYNRDINYGSVELMRTVFDTDISKIKLLSYKQILNIIPFLPKYTFNKLKIKNYTDTIFRENDVYLARSFNQYGDAYAHWNFESTKVKPYPKPENLKVWTNVIKYIEDFNDEIKAKGATLYISYPCLQARTFDNNRELIYMIEKEIEKTGIQIIGTPERYKFPDSLLFDTPYHLIKKGVDIRTNYFIEDFNKIRSPIN